MGESRSRVLFVNGLPVDKGGIETAIMEVYRGLEQDKIVIDFAVRKPQRGCFHDEIESYGGRILNIFENTKHKGMKKWNFWMDIYSVISFYKLLKKYGPYSAVHIPHPLLDGFLILAAWFAGIKVRISHSQNTGIDDFVPLTRPRKWIRRMRLLCCKRLSTHLWGCSKAACEFMFGKQIMSDKRAEVVPNPVNIDRFKQKMDRKEACRLLKISPHNINFINVGRYSPQKNQIFLLNFFAIMLRKRDDLHLLLTGPGPLEKQIREHIRSLGIERHVTMLDKNTPIPVALSASDYFLLPSIYEGFGNVLIEAQAAGVPCFASDVCQPEANAGMIEYIPLERGEKYWAEYILEKIAKPERREVDMNYLNTFHTSTVAPKMQQVYLKGSKYHAEGLVADV